MLGRILRQPDATRRHCPELNQSYAFVVSRNFSETASALRDSLVNGAGFDRKAVGEFVKPHNPNQLDLDRFKDRKIPPIDVPLLEKPVLTHLPKQLKEKITWNNTTKVLTVNSPLSLEDAETLKATVQDSASKTIIDKVAEDSRLVAIEFFQTPAERGERLRVPQLTVCIQGELQLFDDPTTLDYVWELSCYEAKPSEDDISKIKTLLSSADGGELDISAAGKMNISFMAMLQRNLDLVYQPEHWDTVKLATWLCRNIPEPTITHASKQAFVMGWLQSLLEHFSLAEINQQKFLIRNQIEQRINKLRNETITAAYQATVFESENVSVDDNYVFEFPAFYSPSKYYDANSKYGHYSFEHHYYGQIGDFDSKEEFECACYLDQLAAKNKIKFWVRNLVRKEMCSFFLQKADGCFYPDFICLLPDDSILIVEYKGADRWKEAEDDRLIGGLWASLSNGKCWFVMVTEKRWNCIDAVLELVF